MHRALWICGFVLAFAGCFAPSQPVSNQDESSQVGPTWKTTSTLHFAEDPSGEWHSLVLLFPLKLSQATLSTGYYKMTGPTGSGVSILLVDAGNPDRVSYREHLWSRSQFAEEVFQNSFTGERNMTCFEADANGTCLLLQKENGPYNRTLFDQTLSWTPGQYYLLIDLEFGGPFELWLNFTAPVELGPATRIEQATQRVSLELFTADYMDVHRCANVGFCGVVVSGRFNLNLGDHSFGVLRLAGDNSVGAALRACLVPRDVPTCVQSTPVPPIAGTVFSHQGIFVIQEEDGQTSISLDAGGAPMVDDIRPGYTNFYIGGRFIVLDLPAAFPV